MVPLNHFIAAEQHIKWRKIWTNKSYHTHNALECQQISAHIEYSINQYAWLYATSGIFTYSVPVLNGLTRPTRKKKCVFFSAIPNWIQPAVSMTEGLRACVLFVWWPPTIWPPPTSRPSCARVKAENPSIMFFFFRVWLVCCKYSMEK